MRGSTLEQSTDNKVYCLTFPNGKRYIGVTWFDVDSRLREHCKAETVVGNAVRKYGIDNISKSIIMDGLDRESAYRLEIGLIALLMTQDKDLGYNVADGGNCVNRRSDFDIDKSLDMYNSGSSLNEICIEFGIGHNTLARNMSNIGLCRVDRPFSSMPVNIDIDKLIEIRNSGATTTELADIFSVSQSTISNKLRAAGMGGVRNKGLVHSD